MGLLQGFHGMAYPKPITPIPLNPAQELPYTLNPKPETLNHNPKPVNPEPHNPEPGFEASFGA